MSKRILGTLPEGKRKDNALLRVLQFKDGSIEFAMFSPDGKTELGHVILNKGILESLMRGN